MIRYCVNIDRWPASETKGLELISGGQAYNPIIQYISTGERQYLLLTPKTRKRRTGTREGCLAFNSKTSNIRSTAPLKCTHSVKGLTYL